MDSFSKSKVTTLLTTDAKMNRPATANPILGTDKAKQWLLSGQVSDSEPVREFQIHEGIFSIGRRSDSTLCLPVNCVSKNHAEINYDNGQLVISDLGSTNGTFVNGQQINAPTSIKDGDLLQFASIVFRVCEKHQITEHQTIQQDNCDQALALIQFDRLIESGAFIPYFQPIIDMKDQSRIGYEVLGRSRIFGLQTPYEMFNAASQLNLESKLSEVFRKRGIELSEPLGKDKCIFVNTHPKELGTEDFYRSLYELRYDSEQQIILEIHEKAATDASIMSKLVSILKELNIGLAFDDFGVGEARLVELGEYRPDYLKFDMELTRSIDTATPKRLEVVSLLCKLVLDLGILPLAEGIENEESHHILLDMGFTHAQGFYYGKPLPVSKYS